MLDEVHTRNAARRLLKSRLRHALFISQLGKDSVAAQVEEGIGEEANADWLQLLSAWPLPEMQPKLEQLINDALKLAIEDTLSLFAENDDWVGIVLSFRKHFHPNDLLQGAL